MILHHLNPLPDMSILRFSSAAANKDMMAKIWTNEGYSCLLEQKTLWKKKKLLITSKFSFSHNAF